MTSKPYYHDIDQALVGQWKGRVYNIGTSARTTLGGSLNSTHDGLHVWDTDLHQQFYWSGSAWVQGITPIVGAMVYQGAHGSLTTAPSSPQQGYVYVLTVGGTLTWAGQTFNPNAVVQVNDQIVYRGSNVWDVLQGDADEATTATLGLMQLATTGEMTTGNSTHAVTPDLVIAWATSKQFAKAYFLNSITLVADTPFTVSHNLALSNRDAFVCSVKDTGNSEVGVDVDSVDANSLTITSSVAQTGVKISVVGF